MKNKDATFKNSTFKNFTFREFVAILKFLKEERLLLAVLTAEVFKKTKEFLKTELVKTILFSLTLVFFNRKMKECLQHLPNEYLVILFLMLVFLELRT